MNRSRVIIVLGIVVLIIFGLVAAILNITNPNNSSGQSLLGGSNDSFTRVDACDILTKKIVTETFGGEVSGTTPVSGASSNPEMLVTTCSLTSNTGNKTNGTAVLLARVALSKYGAGNNNQEFEINKPEGAVDVKNLGDDAYYVPSFNQLNILKGNNWYILSSYVEDVLDGTLDETVSLAKKLDFK